MKKIFKNYENPLAFRALCGIIYNVEIWAFSRKSKKLTEDQTKNEKTRKAFQF